jgi:hypothetical protein
MADSKVTRLKKIAREYHRHPKGASGGKGGQFAPKDSSGFKGLPKSEEKDRFKDGSLTKTFQVKDGQILLTATNKRIIPKKKLKDGEITLTKQQLRDLQKEVIDEPQIKTKSNSKPKSSTTKTEPKSSTTKADASGKPAKQKATSGITAENAKGSDFFAKEIADFNAKEKLFQDLDDEITNEMENITKKMVEQSLSEEQHISLYDKKNKLAKKNIATFENAVMK